MSDDEVPLVEIRLPVNRANRKDRERAMPKPKMRCAACRFGPGTMGSVVMAHSYDETCDVYQQMTETSTEPGKRHTNTVEFKEPGRVVHRECCCCGTDNCHCRVRGPE